MIVKEEQWHQFDGESARARCVAEKVYKLYTTIPLFGKSGHICRR